MADGEPAFVEAEKAYRDATGWDFRSWGADPTFIVIDADRLFTFWRHR